MQHVDVPPHIRTMEPDEIPGYLDMLARVHDMLQVSNGLETLQHDIQQAEAELAREEAFLQALTTMHQKLETAHLQHVQDQLNTMQPFIDVLHRIHAIEHQLQDIDSHDGELLTLWEEKKALEAELDSLANEKEQAAVEIEQAFLSISDVFEMYLPGANIIDTTLKPDDIKYTIPINLNELDYLEISRQNELDTCEAEQHTLREEKQDLDTRWQKLRDDLDHVEKLVSEASVSVWIADLVSRGYDIRNHPDHKLFEKDPIRLVERMQAELAPLKKINDIINEEVSMRKKRRE